MSDGMRDGMVEATRLTRDGRLAEATDLIQRTLGGRSTPASSSDHIGGSEKEIETIPRLVKEVPATVQPPQSDKSWRALRRAPRKSRQFRGLHRTKTDELEHNSVPVERRFVERTYTNRAGTRGYSLYVPSGYTGQEVPLIVMLHGCTQGRVDLAAGTRMNELAEAHTFLVAYPTQASSANASSCWNMVRGRKPAAGTGRTLDHRRHHL